MLSRLLALAAFLSVSIAAPTLAQIGSSAAAPATTQSNDQAAVPASPNLSDYQLGSGDRVRVITYGEPSLTGEFQVSGVGTISLPLVGEIKAVGVTTTELQARIIAALKNGYMNDPSVSVEVLGYRPFYILGEVNKPGQYPYTTGATVMNAVATASGFTYRANQKKVMIKHASEQGEKLFTLDANTPVSPGDTIRIVERHF